MLLSDKHSHVIRNALHSQLYMEIRRNNLSHMTQSEEFWITLTFRIIMHIFVQESGKNGTLHAILIQNA